MQRLVEAQVTSNCGDRLRRGHLAKKRLGEIARQEVHAEGNKYRNDDERKHAKGQAFDNEGRQTIHGRSS